MALTIEILGWIATILTIAMYAPQTFKAIKTKSVEGLSKTTFTMVAVGSVMWTWFGVSTGLWQAWAANGVVLFLMLPIIYYLFKSSKEASNNFVGFMKANQIFFWTTIFVLANFVVTIILLATGTALGETQALIFSIFGGIGISVPFLPQTIKVIKTKNISSISIVSTVAIIIANIFWTLFYLLPLFEVFEASLLMGMLFSLLGVITSSALAFVYIRNKK